MFERARPSSEADRRDSLLVSNGGVLLYEALLYEALVYEKSEYCDWMEGEGLTR